MSAYIIFCVKSVHDIDGMNEYRRQVAPLTEAHRLEKLAGPMVHSVLEGSSYEAVVVLRFDDVASATIWYESAEYQRVAEIRKSSSISDVFIVDSWPDMASSN